MIISRRDPSSGETKELRYEIESLSAYVNPSHLPHPPRPNPRSSVLTISSLLARIKDINTKPKGHVGNPIEYRYLPSMPENQ